MIGGQVIARTLMEKYDMPKEALSCYDFSDIGDLYHYRKTYKILLNLVPWTEQERRMLIEETKTAYAVNATLFEELYVMLTDMHKKVN
jgi:heme oxygenase